MIYIYDNDFIYGLVITYTVYVCNIFLLVNKKQA